MKAIYFEYPSEYNEFFEKLADKLHEISITDNKKYWCRPFQDISYIKDNNKKMTKLRISLSPIISEYAITNEKEKEKMDLLIEEMWQELLNEDEIIEEDKPVIAKEELENRIENALEFLETQYNTFPSGEMWREALKNTLQGKDYDDVYVEDKKIEMLELSNATVNEQEIEFKINEIIDVINRGD